MQFLASEYWAEEVVLQGICASERLKFVYMLAAYSSYLAPGMGDKVVFWGFEGAAYATELQKVRVKTRAQLLSGKHVRNRLESR